MVDVTELEWYIREEIHTAKIQRDLLELVNLQKTGPSIKLFELRDRATMIPVMAVQLGAANVAERWLLMVAGYGYSTDEHKEYTLLCQINGGRGEMVSDPFKHKMPEMQQAHIYIQDHWAELDHGAVIDLEFLRGEKEAPSKSDRVHFFGKE